MTSVKEAYQTAKAAIQCFFPEFLALLGGAELLDWLFGLVISAAVMKWIHILIIAALIVLSLRSLWNSVYHTVYIDKNKDQKIILAIGTYMHNVQKYSTAVDALTTDTAFRLDPGWHPAGSIAQQYTERYFSADHEKLQGKIYDRLDKSSPERTGPDGQGIVRYKCGSIASITFEHEDFKNPHQVIFIANGRSERDPADQNSPRKLYPSEEDYIHNLWEYVNANPLGTEKELLVHLFGTKFANIPKSPMEVAMEIVDTFLASDAYKNKLIKTLIISIPPEYLESGIDIQQVMQYIKIRYSVMK